ncbi:unnamed protein product [Adineta steineri]|uniref:Uncharacterized protein n=1 Tax=Adineta steineri TaxID=433720 RepID=A0A814X3M4_9BILA|nr:unnamed protein product [Adineta steineri]CAF3579692.1 unnamed protein product [Adineta steineri]
MNNQSTIDEDQKQSSSTTSHRPIRSDLLTKIYYPDTLYPDSYIFFTDRRTSPINVNDQDSKKLPVNTSPTTSKQIPNDIEIIESQSKYFSPMIDRERHESESERRRFDVKRYIPTALRAQDKSQAPAVLLDARFYSMKKTAMTVMCLLIIIMSNSVQLKHVLKRGGDHPFYGTQVTLVIVSVLMCASIGFVQMYTFLFTSLDHLPLSSSLMANLTRYDQLLIILPAILTIFLVLLDFTFLIIMFKF